MKKAAIPFVLFLLVKTVALGQIDTLGSQSEKLRLDSAHRADSRLLVVGTLSVGLPTGPLAGIAKTAIYVSSGIEYRATKHLTLMGLSEVWTARVELPPTADQPFAIRGRSNNLFVSANVGYYQSAKRWRGYGFVGAGAGLISKPSVEFLFSDTYNVMATSEIQPIWRVGAGLEYRITNTLVPYLEVACASTFNDTTLGNRKFSYVSAGLGIKAYLKLKGVFNRN